MGQSITYLIHKFVPHNKRYAVTNDTKERLCCVPEGNSYQVDVTNILELYDILC